MSENEAAVLDSPLRFVWIRDAAAVALMVWAFGLVLYFYHQEGLINWKWLVEPQSSELAGRHRGFNARFAPAVHPGAYVAVLKGIPGTYRVNWSNIPYLDLAISTIMLGAYLLLGLLLLGSMEVYFRRWAHLCMAFVLGAGTAGVAFELLTLAGLLNRWGVVSVWILLFAVSFSLRELRLHRRGREPSVQVKVARQWMERSLLQVHPGPQRVYFVAAIALISTISLLILLHGIGTPESYWDSLILYIGYARMMFLEQRFPLKVVGQVGIGLGANYPHLYPLLTAQTAALAGHWNDMFAQLLPPVAGLVSTVLVYNIALDLTRNRLVAVSAALLYRAVPYGIIYHTYASDYAIAILFTAAFLHAAQKYIIDGLPRYFTLTLLMAAFAVHVNYLMWLLWAVAAVVFHAAHAWNKQTRPVRENESMDDEDPTVIVDEQPAFMMPRFRPGFWHAIHSPHVVYGVIFALCVASPWYIRNVVITGNPVYAFYYNLFPSKNVNPEVMRSAEQEWLLNGDGVGRVGRTLAEKLSNSWLYFVTGEQHWKMAPVFIAFVLPGFLVFAGRLLGSVVVRRQNVRAFDDTLRFGYAAGTLFLLLWFYEYCIASMYLYQIVVVLPLFGIFVCYLFDVIKNRYLRGVCYGLCLAVGFAPGVVVGLMGFKLKHTGVYKGMPSPQFHLTALKNLFMDPKQFYRMEFGGDMEMFGRLDALPPTLKVLTHENRHRLLRERKIVHLDDWDVQKTYGKSAEERIHILDSLDLRYYLYVPNEDKHVVNSRVGMDELIGLGYFKEDYRTESSGTSTPELVEHKNIPRNLNVLYRRTEKK